MNAVKNTEQQQEEKIIFLYVKNENTFERELLVKATWAIAQAAFWNERHFSPDEVSSFKKLITEHYEQEQSEVQIFKELAERICLTKRYLSRNEHRYIPEPEVWLNKKYKSGLSGTAKWLQQVEEQRKTVPAYNKGIATFANAVYKYAETSHTSVFYRYRRLLMEEQQYDLLQLFYNTIIHLQFF